MVAVVRGFQPSLHGMVLAGEEARILKDHKILQKVNH